MPLDHVEPVGQVPRLGLEEVQPRPAIRSEIELRPVVPAPAEPAVDDPVGRALGLKHVAEGGEGLGRQRLGADRVVLATTAHAGSRSARRSSAMRSTWAQAVAISVSRLLPSRVRNASRIEALVLSRTAMMKGKPNFAV